MLFDVTAVLSTSVALGPVAEAFGVHEITRHDTAIVLVLDVPAIPIPDAPPLPFIGPQPAESPNEFVQGTRLLQQVSLLDAARIPDFLTANPAFIDEVLAAPPAATDVTVWWNALDAAHRVTLRDTAPQLIGNLEGVPYAARDLANRTLLQQTMSSLQSTIGGDAGRSVIEQAQQQLKMLQSIDSALGASNSLPRRTLLTLDVDGQGRAAIVVGDLRTADYVSYLVPGMFFTIENQMGDWVDAATRLYDEQRSLLAHFAHQEGRPQTSTVATVAWIGYHTPNLTNVGGIDNAYEGRDSLASAIEGLQALRGADQPYLSVIAHSYGSTAALMALTEYDFEIDALALVGSPGSAAKSVDQLHVRDGNVFVGEAAWDPVPNSSYFGSDPGSPEYGAHRMSVQGGVDVLTGEVLAGSAGHNEYFSPGTESMRNFALLAIGKGEFVTSGNDGGAEVAKSLHR